MSNSVINHKPEEAYLTELEVISLLVDRSQAKPKGMVQNFFFDDSKSQRPNSEQGDRLSVISKASVDS
jgi:hypothetical protein